MPDPYHAPDADSRAVARRLIDTARHAALGVIDPATGAPAVSRIAICAGDGPQLLGLVSELSAHTAALRATPAASLLIGEPGARGDPLTHPRLTLQVETRFVAADDPARPAFRLRILDRLPKTRLYIDFADFSIVTFTATSGLLVAGFGRATRLGPGDLSQ